MQDDKALLKLMWATGQFWDKATPEVLNVKQSDVALLTLQDSVAKLAVRNFQESDANLRPFSYSHHGRAPIPDGDVGPATRQLATIPRCPMPDHAPPPNAVFHYDDPRLQEAVESYQEWAAATGSGSWPVGCDSENKNVHSVVVSILTAGFSSHQKTLMKEVLTIVEKCEAEMGQSVRHVLDGSPSAAQHDVRGENIPGGVIGYAYFPRPGTCNQVVVARIDNTFNESAIVLANLYVHEYKGHSDGLEHTNGGIMNPSINVINPLSWRGDPHEATKRRYFGGEPIQPPPPPGPPPPPNCVRIKRPASAGDYGDFALGSNMGAGDYMLVLLGDEGSPPPVP